MTWEELLEWVQKLPPPEKRREKVDCAVYVKRFNRTVKADSFDVSLQTWQPHLVIRM